MQNGDTVVFEYTGDKAAVSLPPGKYRLKCYGAQGGYRSTPINGGQGGYAEGILTLTEQQSAYFYVGGSGNSGGFNGGGSRTNSLPRGGGATDIRLGEDSLLARIIVAGGGGSDGASNKPGGHGGGAVGVSRTESYGSGGVGASQTASGDYRGAFGFGGAGQTASNGYGGAGGGGSGYALTAESHKPDGYLLGDEYYLTEIVMSQVGRDGDGLIVVEIIEIGKEKFLARDAEGIKAWKGDLTMPQATAIVAEQWAETTEGTTLSASVSAVVGNTVVAIVTTRSETVFSDGWDIISELNRFSTSNQNLYVLVKPATSTVESITATQTASARIYVQLLVFNKVLKIFEEWRTSSPDDSVNAVSVPAKAMGSQILWVLSANLWTTASPYGKWSTNPSDLIRYSSPFDLQDRQAVFFDNGIGAASDRSFSPVSATGIGIVMLRIADDTVIEGCWETVGNDIDEELFLEYGVDILPQSVDGLLDDAELLLWTDRKPITDNPHNFKLKLSAEVSPPTQVITQTVPFAMPSNSVIDYVSLVTDTQNGGAADYDYAVSDSGICFVYTLEKPDSNAVEHCAKQQ